MEYLKYIAVTAINHDQILLIELKNYCVMIKPKNYIGDILKYKTELRGHLCL